MKKSLLPGLLLVFLLTAIILVGCEDVTETKNLPKSATPAIASGSPDTVNKTSITQGTVNFALSKSYAASDYFLVYSAETGLDIPAGVFASVNGAMLSLNKSGGINAGEYWVSVTEEGKAESDRLKLTIGEYIPSTQTPTPEVNEYVVNKTSLTQKEIVFNLADNYGTGVWKVYYTQTATVVSALVSVEVTGTTLKLIAEDDNLDETDYYVTFTKDGNFSESLRMVLTVSGMPQSATPSVTAATIQKTSFDQTPVNFTLTAAAAGTDVFVLYDSASANTNTTGVSVSASGTVLSLIKADGVTARQYWVTVAKAGEKESARLLLTVTEYVPPQSATPSVTTATIQKTSFDQTPVDFTLTAAAAGTDVFALYDSASANTNTTGVSVSASGTVLSLIKADGVTARQYWVTVTKAGERESNRLLLTVEEFIPPGKSLPPTAAVSSVRKTSADQTSVTFTLGKSYAEGHNFFVYDDDDTSTESAKVTVSVTGDQLSLINAGGVPAGEYWVSVIESGDSIESNRLKLTVVEYSTGVDITPAGMTANDIAAEIIDFLTDKDEVLVVGNRTDFDEVITLNIPANKTVNWEANLTGTARTAAAALIDFTTGTGTLEIQNGSITAKGTRGIGIRVGIGGLIRVSGGSVTSESTNTADGAILLANTGARLSMTGGTVENMAANSAAKAINNTNSTNTNAVVVSGGTVRANTGIAIQNTVAGAVRISEANPAVPTLITSANATAGASTGTIVITLGQLYVSGGRVENTSSANGAQTIRSQSTDNNAVVISGGTVSINLGIGIWHQQSTGRVTVSGGLVRSGAGLAIYMNNSTNVSTRTIINGNGVVYGIGTTTFATGQGGVQAGIVNSSGAIDASAVVTGNGVVIASENAEPGSNLVSYPANAAVWEDSVIRYTVGSNTGIITP